MWRGLRPHDHWRSLRSRVDFVGVGGESLPAAHRQEEATAAGWPLRQAVGAFQEAATCSCLDVAASSARLTAGRDDARHSTAAVARERGELPRIGRPKAAPYHSLYDSE